MYLNQADSRDTFVLCSSDVTLSTMLWMKSQWIKKQVATFCTWLYAVQKKNKQNIWATLKSTNDVNFEGHPSEQTSSTFCLEKSQIFY